MLAMNSRSVEQPRAVDAARAAGARVDPVELVEQPLGVAHRGVDEREDVVPERRGLRVLQVRLVRHHRLGVLLGTVDGGEPEAGGVADQLDDLAPDVQAQRDPHGLAAGAPGVQPARGVADPGDEVGLARVVGLAQLGVVGEVLGRRRVGLEEQRQDRLPGVVGYEAAAREVEHVPHVGQVQPAVQERGVGVLQREAGVDELGRRGRPRGARLADATCGHGAPVVAGAGSPRWVRADATPPVCQRTTGSCRPSCTGPDRRRVRATANALAP